MSTYTGTNPVVIAKILWMGRKAVQSKKRAYWDAKVDKYINEMNRKEGN